MLISPIFLIAVLLGGGYAGYRFFALIGDMTASGSAMIELIVCALTVICCIICIIRTIYYWISIGMICFSNKVTRGILNVTNSVDYKPSSQPKTKKKKSGILKTTNSDD